jgi:nucleoside-diphosphate-sugar epimerase
MAALHAGQSGVVNIGTGRGTTIAQLAATFAVALGFATPPKIVKVGRIGDIRHSVADTRRALDLLGFEAVVSLEEGVLRTCQALMEKTV